jgi:hypothetical protein
MLSKSIFLRYRDYEALLEDLTDAKAEATAKRLGIELHPQVRPPRPNSPPPKLPQIPVIVAAVVAVICATLVFAVWPRLGKKVSVTELALANPGFEAPLIAAGNQGNIRPAGWESFSGGASEQMWLSTVCAHDGTQSVRFWAHGLQGFYQGLYQSLPAVPGKTYHFSAYVLNDATSPLRGSVTGQLSIEWHDANNREITRSVGPSWGPSLSSKTWTRLEVMGVAPPNVIMARFVIVEKSGDQPATGCTFYIDDALAVKAP